MDLTESTCFFPLKFYLMCKKMDMNELNNSFFSFKSAGNIILSSSLSGDFVKRGHSRCRNNHTFNNDSSETRSQLLSGLVTIWKLRRRAWATFTQGRSKKLTEIVKLNLSARLSPWSWQT